jgi:hypothetical protein
MDDGGSEVDHHLKAAVCLVISHCDAFEFFQLAEEVLGQVAPFVDVLVDVERLGAPLMLRDDDVFDVQFESLVGNQAPGFDILDQGRDADGVEAVAGQKDKPHQIAKRVGQREDFGGQPTLRLPDGLFWVPLLRPARAGEL